MKCSTCSCEPSDPEGVETSRKDNEGNPIEVACNCNCHERYADWREREFAKALRGGRLVKCAVCSEWFTAVKDADGLVRPYRHFAGPAISRQICPGINVMAGLV